LIKATSKQLNGLLYIAGIIQPDEKAFTVLSIAIGATLANAQTITNEADLVTPAKLATVEGRDIGSDSLSSGNVIWIKTELKAHKHLTHSEHVYVIDGEAEMRLGDKTVKIKNGDIIFIPKGTVHAVKVTSKRPLKVLSVQAPHSDGTDRVFVNE
jgi:mannose-6-phosphate isomerase-like protein (cupin superfamily)